MKSVLQLILTYIVLGVSLSWAGPVPSEHAGHGAPIAASSHGHEAANTAGLVLKTDPVEVRPGISVRLIMRLVDAHGGVIKDFEISHEKKVHLIIVRQGLDTFAHLHPDVTASGELSATHVFTVPGTYLLYADHKPKGSEVATAMATLVVLGPDVPAKMLKVDVPGQVRTVDLVADIQVEKRQDVQRIRFALSGPDGARISNLEPYLGAMGHLVVVSADGKKYVHAHPVADSGQEIAFDAHFPGSGLYKGWGQFKRSGAVFDIPFVIGIGEEGRVP